MIINKRWYSPEGLILELSPNVHTLYGKLYLPENFYSRECDFFGIISENEEKHEVAFVINWKTIGSISFTAFTGKVNKEGNLLLDWLLSSQGLNTNKIESVSGSSILSRSTSRIKPNQEFSPSLPYPLELQSTPLSSDSFSPNNQLYLH
jgi:hypothetical protein